MKSVILIGDSIRMGYQETVRDCLGDRVDIWTPEKNGGDSTNVVANIQDWVLDRKPDILHLNCGLHDLKKDFETGTPAIALTDYADNLRTLFKIVTEAGITLTWATTTPVNEKRHHAVKPFDRFEADVAAYNEAALTVAREFSVNVDDLYSTVMQAGRDALLSADGVHFTPDGYRLLGQTVAEFLKPYVQ